jgi:hypothetical protein
MTKKKAVSNQLTEQENRLLEQLRRHPELRERFQSILDLVSGTDGPLQTADEVEALLIEAVRRLGHTTMSRWAVQAEERVSQELQAQEPEVRSRKKKR